MNDICNVSCADNACYMLYVDCIGTCHISTVSTDTVYPITDISNLIYPIHNLEYEAPQSTMDNEKMCNEPTAVTYDNYRENYRASLTLIDNQNVCCRGAGSCRETPFEHINSDIYKQLCAAVVIHVTLGVKLFLPVLLSIVEQPVHVEEHMTPPMMCIVWVT
eukprot:275248_1